MDQPVSSAAELSPPVWENRLAIVLVAAAFALLALGGLIEPRRSALAGAGVYFGGLAFLLHRVRPAPGKRFWFRFWIAPFFLQLALYGLAGAVQILLPGPHPAPGFVDSILLVAMWLTMLGLVPALGLTATAARGLPLFFFLTFAPWLVFAAAVVSR